MTAQRKRQWLLVGLFCICALPFVAAHWLHNIGWQPSTRTNAGVLLKTPLTLTALTGQPVVPIAYAGKWVMLYVDGGACTVSCTASLEKMKQVHGVMGKNTYRVERIALLGKLDEGTQQRLTQAFPRMGVYRVRDRAFAGSLPNEPNADSTLSGKVYLADPHGNVILSYPNGFPREALFQDIKHVLAYSHIG